MAFNATIFLSLVCMLAVCAIAVVEYIVFVELFEKIASQMSIFYLQIGSISDLMEASSMILQSIAYNQGQVDLAHVHPGYGNQTAAQFGNFTEYYIGLMTDNFNYKLINRRNIPYASVMDDLYTAKIGYEYKDVNLSYSSVYLEMAYLLLLDASYYMCREDSVTDLGSKNLHMADFEYNTKNSILKKMRLSMAQFSLDMSDLAESQLASTNIIVYSFKGE